MPPPEDRDLVGLEPDPDRWHVEEFDEELDSWPDDHHAQSDEDPPDLD